MATNRPRRAGPGNGSREPLRHDSARGRAIAAFVLAAPQGKPDRTRAPRGESKAWQPLVAGGSALWLDAADLQACLDAWSGEFSGLTTNNSLLNGEVQKGGYDDLIPQAGEMLRRAESGLSDQDLVTDVALVLNAVHALAMSDALGVDVSVELHTDIAYDAEASYEAGRLLHAISPERFIVKIPSTPAGLLAARRLGDEGVRVNVTLGFSARQNRLIAEFAQPHFVNVFLGRVDSLLDSSGLPTTAEGGHSPGIRTVHASQRMLRGRHPGAEGARDVRQIAASLRSVDQLPLLRGIDVLTIPVALAAKYAERPATTFPGEDEPARPAPDDAEEQLLRDERVETFWDPGDVAGVAARQITVRELETDAERVQAVLIDSGLGDLFPHWSEEDRARIAADGKIPDWSHWRDRVRDGTASWDGLLTAAGLADFERAQRELDARIRKLL